MSFVPTYPAPPGAALATYIQVLKDTRISNYLAVASYTLLLYDVLTSLDSEYEFVWRAPFSKGTILYTSMRYGTLLLLTIGLPYSLWPNASFRFCKVWFYIDTMVGANLTAVPVSGLLALRTYALYQRDKMFKWILLFLFTALNLVLVICLIIHLITVRLKPPPATLPGWTCPLDVTYASRRIILAQFSALVVYESIIFILTAYRVYESWEDTRIVKIIFWDCLFYYTVILLTSITSLMLIFILPEHRAALRGLFMDPLRAISVLLASRLVLRLRKFVAEPDMSILTFSTPLPPLRILPTISRGSVSLGFLKEERRYTRDMSDV